MVVVYPFAAKKPQRKYVKSVPTLVPIVSTFDNRLIARDSDPESKLHILNPFSWSDNGRMPSPFGSVYHCRSPDLLTRIVKDDYFAVTIVVSVVAELDLESDLESPCRERTGLFRDHLK